jgi:hypothetical protein
MDASWVAIIVAAAGIVVSIVATCWAGSSARSASRAADAAQEQTDLQRQAMRDAASPHIWVDIAPSSGNGRTLELLVGNSGAGMATNVRITTPDEIPTAGEPLASHLSEALERLDRGLYTLSPGRTLTWALGPSEKIVSRPLTADVIRFTIHGSGPFGPLPEQTIAVSLNDWRTMNARPEGSMREISNSIGTLTAETKQLRESLKDS